MKFKVRIEHVEEYEEEISVVVETSTNEASWAISTAIERFFGPRPTELLAKIVSNIERGSGFNEETFPGQNQLEDYFVEAACKLEDAWADWRISISKNSESQEAEVEAE